MASGSLDGILSCGPRTQDCFVATNNSLLLMVLDSYNASYSKLLVTQQFSLYMASEATSRNYFQLCLTLFHTESLIGLVGPHLRLFLIAKLQICRTPQSSH